VHRAGEVDLSAGGNGRRAQLLPGALHAALTDSNLAEVTERTQRDIDVPTLAIFGSLDPRLEFAAAQKEFFAGEYRHEVVDGGSASSTANGPLKPRSFFSTGSPFGKRRPVSPPPGGSASTVERAQPGS